MSVAELEQNLSNAKELAGRRAMALRLYENPDFQKLIMQEFLVTECARYAQNSGNPALDAVGRADSLAMAQAAGHLKRLLSVTVQMGEHAARSVEDIEDTLAQARAEEGGA